MRHRPELIIITALLVCAAAGCDSGRHSAAGFRLADDGNAEQGKTTFVELGCNNCHTVDGVELPAPTDKRPVSVALGGEKGFDMNDGYLVTSIINPSYKLANHPKDQITAAGVSLMPVHALAGGSHGEPRSKVQHGHPVTTQSSIDRRTRQPVIIDVYTTTRVDPR